MARYGKQQKQATRRRIIDAALGRIALERPEVKRLMTIPGIDATVALSLLAVYAGVAAIVGAFLAGLALGETVDRRVHELASGVRLDAA